MATPWKDALKAADAPRAAAAPAPTAIDLAMLSPQLSALAEERQRLETRMAALAQGNEGPATSDPRFVVAPFAERRADHRAWERCRERGRAQKADAPDARQPRPASREPDDAGGSRIGRNNRSNDAQPPVRDNADRDDAARAAGPEAQPRRRAPQPALRETPGERVIDADRPPPARADDDTVPWRRLMPPDLPDPIMRLSMLREQLREQLRDKVPAIDRVRNAIPDDWRRRAREAVPALGEGDTYARRAEELLSVATGTLDEIGEQSDKLRSLAADVRELRASDEAGDDARRRKALDRLRARKQEM